MVVLADLTGNPAINLRNPGWHSGADMDGPWPKRRGAGCTTWWRRTDPDLGLPLSVPGGRLRREGRRRYRLVPVSWIRCC